MDRYVKGDPSADARLLTNRWRDDGTEASVDPNHDGNLLSFFYGSRLAITRADGTEVDCETMRAGCPQLSDDDRFPGEYSCLGLATSPE